MVQHLCQVKKDLTTVENRKWEVVMMIVNLGIVERILTMDILLQSTDIHAPTTHILYQSTLLLLSKDGLNFSVHKF